MHMHASYASWYACSKVMPRYTPHRGLRTTTTLVGGQRVWEYLMPLYRSGWYALEPACTEGFTEVLGDGTHLVIPPELSRVSPSVYSGLLCNEWSKLQKELRMILRVPGV